MNLVVRPLTPALWPAFENLFDTTGAVGQCWCMYWRIGAEYRRREPRENQADFRHIVDEGAPPGLLAFDGDLAVGWCQLTPRDELARLERSKNLARVDQVPVWSISCFYVRRGHRRQGVTAALVDAAVERARQAGAVAVEAYPLDDSSPSSSFTGYASTFERAGFTTVARHTPSRPIMRLELGAV